ncbi:MAG: Holliday junction branch migration protein RuvA, partial [Selenomonadaceae bacterium]|nr:Holliday junction branch migration protein RuvA [Selenomonadaceae bacterium]
RQALTLGEATELFIHTAVREDAINLFGMKNQSTFELFELLLTVSGVGAKGALAIVSKISAAEFSRAVAAQDIKTLTRLPGVGKQSAERILLELKDKVQSLAENFSAEDFQSAQIQSTEREDAAEALEALGYTAAEISAAFDNAPENFSTEQLIKFALKNLSGR